MKLTLELPEDLLHGLRERAVLEDKTFKALVEEVLRKGLATVNTSRTRSAKTRAYPVRPTR
jgi:hypothetical protein